MAARIIATIFLIAGLATGAVAQVKLTTTDIMYIRQKVQIGTDTSKYFTSITDTINASSTHRQAPTAKAVYMKIAAMGSGPDGHVIMEGNTPRAHRDSLEFQANSSIVLAATNTATRTVIDATIESNAVGAAEIAADAVGSSEIAADAVGNSELAANAVDSTNVVNGGLSVLDLGQHGASSGNVLKWNGTQWAPGTDNNSGGTVTGTGTDTYVAYWNGTSSLTGEAAFTYNATSDALSVGASNPVSITGSAITTAQAFTIGGSSSALTLSGTGSGGLISLNTTGLSASGAVSVGGSTGSGSTETAAFGITKGQTITSGSNPRTMMKISGAMSNTGGSTGILRGLWVVPSALTTIVDYRGIDLDFNDALAKGIYQSGALVTNNFVGWTKFGGTGIPARALETSELRVTDLTTDNPTRLMGADGDGDVAAVKVGNNLTISNDTLHANLSAYIDGSGGAGQVGYFSDSNTLTSEAALNYDATNNRVGINKSSPAVKLDIQAANSTDGIRLQSDATVDQDVWGMEYVGTATGSYVQRGRIGMDVYSASGSSPDGHSLNFVLSRDGGSTYTALALYNSQALFNRASSFTIANNTAELRLAPNDYSQIRMYHTGLLAGAAHGTLDTTSRFRVVGRTLTSNTYSATFRDQGNGLILAVRDDKRVGINTSTIDAALTVVALGATSSTYGLIVTPSGGTTSTASIVVRDDNRVGIRTNAPQAPLNVVGTGTTSGTTALLVEGSGGQDNLNVRDDGVNIGQGFAMASSAPSISFGSAAGTGPSNDLCSGGANGFLLAFTSGTAPATNAAIFTATLPKTYPAGVVATWSCGDTDCLDEAPDIYISGTGNNSVTISTRGTLTASTAYLIYVTCFGY